MKRWSTVQDFIASGKAPASETVAAFEGFASKGDGGASFWVKTGLTGVPSQSPTDLNAAVLTDSQGVYWRPTSGAIFYFDGTNQWFPTPFGGEGAGLYQFDGVGWNYYEQAGGAVSIAVTTGLITNEFNYDVGTALTFAGYSIPGDGGGAQWVKTATIDTPSQTPAARGDGTLTDALGFVWSLSGERFGIKAFGVTGSGDEAATFQSALNSGLGISLRSLTSITIGTPITIPDNADIVNGLCKIIIDFDTADFTDSVVIGNNVTSDKFRFELPAGRTLLRGVSIGDNPDIGSINFKSIDQINNRTEPLDAAIQVKGEGGFIGKIRTENMDNGVVIYQADGVEIGNIICKSYVRGVFIESSDSVDLDRLRCITASPNAFTNPGNNGILIENSKRLSLGRMYIENAGEHAFRIGGGAGDLTEDVQVDSIYAYKPGQCALKINPDDVGDCFRVTIGTLTGVDCSATTATGTNEDVCRLERVKDVTIGQVNGYRKDNGNCGNDGVYLNGAERVVISNINLDLPNRSMLYIEDTKGQCKNITISTFELNGCNSIPIVINSPTESIEHIQVKNGYMRDTTPDTEVVSITASSPTGGVPNAVLLRFDVDVSGFTTPGSVTAADLISSNTTASRIYNEMTPRP